MLERLHDETRADVKEIHGDELFVEPVIASHVAHHGLQQIVHLAAHAVALEDLRDVLDHPLKGLGPGLRVLVGLDQYVHREPKADLLGVYQGKTGLTPNH